MVLGYLKTEVGIVNEVKYRRIRDLREDKDLTQTQMAEYLNCSQRVYCDYELGKVRMTPEILIELSDFHGTSVDYLLELTDIKEPYPRNDKRKK